MSRNLRLRQSWKMRTGTNWMALARICSVTGRKEKGDPLNIAIDKMTKKTRDLRRQLRKAVMDHISDSFLETNVPLLVLIEAAKSGNEKEVKEYAQVFREHANKLVEVANLACSISNNEEGVKLVRMAATQIDSLCPQVINAALTLAARPQSKVAQDNMDVFKDQWEKQVRVLTEAVDDITSVDDFLSVSENHILEDVNKCVIALQEGDVDTLDRTAGAIRGRAARVIHIINAEMENYEAGVYTEKVLEATKLLSETVMPRFAEQVEVAIEALSANVPQPFEENEFIDASRLVYDGVRDIRKAVLMIRTPEELEDDSDFEQEDYDVRSRTSVQTEDDQLIAGQSARAIMAQLPQEEKAKIAEQVEIFHQEKSKLDAEVAKWDDSGNDIIVLAKQMCMIMMEMTDFTRGKGPLKNTSDVINAAKKIAEAGSRMDKLARAVADQCPDSACKQDLLAYLQRIALYCHQLNICSKVKAEVQNLGGELIVSGTGVQSTFTTFYEVDCDVIDGGRASQLSTHLPTCAEGAPIGSGSSDSSMIYSQDSCIRLEKQRGSEEETGSRIFAAELNTIYLKMESVLDSATSLIQAAKNLMNAVVLTVKASYVASTKYQKVYGTAAVNSPVVSWKMKAPEKKPLVKREKPEEFQTRVRRGSQKKHISPVQALSEFKAMDSF
uniref:Catenin alpha-2 n=1 Tax=Callithrix jacchus TaxID=9483 RepID=A0A8I3WHV1_CALJA